MVVATNNNACGCASSEQPGHERPVEPVAVLLAAVLEGLLRLVGDKGFLFAVDDILAGVKVGFMRLNALGFHEEFVAEDAKQVDRDSLESTLVAFMARFVRFRLTR